MSAEREREETPIEELAAALREVLPPSRQPTLDALLAHLEPRAPREEPGRRDGERRVVDKHGNDAREWLVRQARKLQQEIWRDRTAPLTLSTADGERIAAAILALLTDEVPVPMGLRETATPTEARPHGK